MPRKTRLQIVNERPLTDFEAAQLAGQALDEAEAAEHPQAPPEDILAMLRSQLAETARVANAAIETANNERAIRIQVEQELDHAKTDSAKVRETAVQEVSRARQDAASTVAQIERQAAVAERTLAAAAGMRQVAAGMGAILSFLIDRAPVLLTLIGSYLLARDILPQPSITQLSLIAIYGTVAVAPAVWLSIRRQ